MGSIWDIHISTYAICKNESKFVNKWVKNMWSNGKGTNKLYILDTGSTDDTLNEFDKVLKEINAPKDWCTIQSKTYNEFRFDIARNDNMAMIDEDNTDVLFCIDLDELVIDSFWSDLRGMVYRHPNFDRIFYKYSWSHYSNGEPNLVFWYDKITQPHWRWKYPVHECLYKTSEDYNYQGNYYLDSTKIYLHHYPDSTKSRSDYLNLLIKRVQEDPSDLYGIYYLAREYSFRGDYLNAIEKATSLYIKLLKPNPSSEALKAREDKYMLPSLCCMIGNFYECLKMREEAQYFYQKSINIDSSYREGYIKLALLCSHTGQTKLGFKTLKDMKIKSKFICDWRSTPYIWKEWLELSIKGNLYSWGQDNKSAYKYYQRALKKLKTPEDINNFNNLGLLNDYKFILNKYKEEK